MSEEKKVSAGAPIEWLKEYSAAIAIIITIIGSGVLLRDDINDRTTQAEVQAIVQKEIAVHALIPHPGVRADLKDAHELTNAVDKRLVAIEFQLQALRRQIDEIKGIRK